ncbi:hypothetical protein [Nostoc sp.]|uniref:hypothetical protein n=1 Tax=Nostoc sp. TaxID=1180 RepID=UPI002FFCF969
MGSSPIARFKICRLPNYLSAPNLGRTILPALYVYAIALVNEWSDRKRKLFKPEHIRKAWQRLYEQNWLNIKEQITS